MQPSVQSFDCIVRRRMLRLIGEAMNHDRAAGRPAILARPQLVFLVGVGHLNGQEVLAAGIAPSQVVPAFRSSKIVFALLLSR